MFANHTRFRGFDAARITIVNGGFRDEGRTQLWLVPPGGEPPVPSDTLPAPEIPTGKTFLFDRNHIFDGEVEDPDEEFLLPAVKAQREAEAREAEEEYKRESLPNGEKLDEAEPETEPEEAAEPVDANDELTDEEKEEMRFSWLSESFGKLLAKKEQSNGILIFYADDQTYDIAKIELRIKEGLQKLSKDSKLKVDRIKIVFGGYRSAMEVEFFVVPKMGKEPTPTPEERPIEESETETSDG